MLILLHNFHLQGILTGDDERLFGEDPIYDFVKDGKFILGNVWPFKEIVQHALLVILVSGLRTKVGTSLRYYSLQSLADVIG